MSNNFSENLKKIRKDNNMSQEQLAEELGVSRQAISKWESAVAYPEMDKIIAIGEKFNLNIDDLLHKDIREIKGEEESKKNLNKYIDDFLNFITSTINMFCKMSFNSKIKCLFEQIIIGLVLMIIFGLIGTIGRDLLANILGLLPNKIFYVISTLINSVYTIFSFIVSLIIMIHLFKTRYLNYFEKISKEEHDDCPNEELKDNEIEEKTNSQDNNKLDKRKERKIIIRDPKHSEYKFIDGIFKVMVMMIKFFALSIAIMLFGILIALVFSFILSFLVYKTGLCFIGLLILLIALVVINIDGILLILNFIFNRKNNKKMIIWSIIISIISIGVGSGLISIGLLDFEYVQNDKSEMKTDYIEFEMNDELFFEENYYFNDIEYIEADNTNIKVEAQVNKYYEINHIKMDYLHNKAIYLDTRCTNPVKLVKEVLLKLNNKKIIDYSNNYGDVKIYTTKENINKLKKNRELYELELEKRDDLINYYENRIGELEQKNAEYSEKISRYEGKIDYLLDNGCQGAE